MRQPRRSRAASTRRALVAAQLLTQYLEGHVEGGRGHVGVLDPVRNYLDGQSLGVADGIFAGFAVSHHAREFQRFGNPAPIVLTVQFDGKVHIVIVQQAVVLGARLKNRRLLVCLIKFGEQLSERKVNSLPAQHQADGISSKKLYVALLE